MLQEKSETELTASVHSPRFNLLCVLNLHMLQFTVNVLTVWIQPMPDTTKTRTQFTTYVTVYSEYLNCLDPANAWHHKVTHIVHYSTYVTVHSEYILTVWIQWMPDTTKTHTFFTTVIVYSEYPNCLDPANAWRHKDTHIVHYICYSLQWIS